MEYKWTINKVQTSSDNLIVKVDLTVMGTDDNNAKFFAVYTRNLIRGDSFIPYDQLTEQQVLNWCFAPEIITWTDKDNVEQSVVKYLKDDGEAQIIDQQSRQLSQKIAEPTLPWLEIPA